MRPKLVAAHLEGRFDVEPDEVDQRGGYHDLEYGFPTINHFEYRIKISRIQINFSRLKWLRNLKKLLFALIFIWEDHFGGRFLFGGGIYDRRRLLIIQPWLPRDTRDNRTG